MKDYREKEIKYLYISYFALFLYCSTDVFTTFAQNNCDGWYKLLSFLGEAAIASVVSLLSFVFDSIISSKMKERLVGLFHIPKAGCTIFSRLKAGKIKDDRFLNDEAVCLYSDIISALPNDKQERRRAENSAWYRIYINKKDDETIYQAQKDYLLCRDLFVDTIIFFVVYLLSAAVFCGAVHISKCFILVLIIIAILTNVATHVKMHRFVNTVIAIDVAASKNKI